jgi:hypothetical protein
MMNDPTVLEASRVLAQHLVTENNAVTLAFRTIVCRHPTKKEEQVLADYYADQLQLFRSKQLDAGKTLNIGEYPQANTDPATTAALMKVIELIYNLEETITRT